MIYTDKELTKQVEERARLAGVTLDTLCAEAGVASTTFSRQKHGKSRVVSESFRKVVAALEKIEKKKGIVSKMLSPATPSKNPSNGEVAESQGV